MRSWEAQEILEAFLANDDWEYNKNTNEEDEDKASYYTGIKIDSVVKTLDIQIVVSDEEVAVMAFYPVDIDEDRSAEVNEFVTRINNVTSGYARFELIYPLNMLVSVWHHIIAVGEDSFDERLAENIVYSVVELMSDFADDIFLVANGGVSGKEQYMKVEKRWEEDEKREAEREESFDSADGSDETDHNDKEKSIKFYIKL